MSDRKRSNLKGFDPITVLEAVQTLLSRIPEIDESERFNLEWNAFYEWAQDNRAVYPEDIGPSLPQLGRVFGIPSLKDNVVQWGEQGHEHDIFLAPPYYYKKTKWNCAGYTFDSESKTGMPASVREYLIRLVLHNVFFNTEIEILGIIVKNNDRALFIRQRIVDGVVPSSMEEMEELFCRQYPCKKIKDESHYQGYKGNVYKIAIFYISDMRPDNCKIVTRENGERHIIPFDCVISIDENELRKGIGILKNQMESQ